MIDGFPLQCLLKVLIWLASNCSRLRIRNSSSYVGLSALIRKTFHRAIKKSKLITRNTEVMKQYFTLEVPKDSAFPFIA